MPKSTTNLTKFEIAQNIYARIGAPRGIAGMNPVPGLKREDIASVVQAMLDELATALVAGRSVEIRNFGVFEVKSIKPRVGRNPKNPGVDIRIPARKVIRFSAGKELFRLINIQT